MITVEEALRRRDFWRTRCETAEEEVKELRAQVIRLEEEKRVCERKMNTAKNAQSHSNSVAKGYMSQARYYADEVGALRDEVVRLRAQIFFEGGPDVS